MSSHLTEHFQLACPFHFIDASRRRVYSPRSLDSIISHHSFLHLKYISLFSLSVLFEQRDREEEYTLTVVRILSLATFCVTLEAKIDICNEEGPASSFISSSSVVIRIFVCCCRSYYYC